MTENSEKVTTIGRVRLLHEHTDEESAYLVDDHPYGGGLRCQIRYWVDTATKGQKRGQQRYVYQTTNPRKLGHPWNKPHPQQYYQLVVLYLDGDDHVKWWGTGLPMYPTKDARARLMGVYDQFTDDQRANYDAILRWSKRGYDRWGEFDEAVTALAAEIAYTGKEPEFKQEGWTVWETPNGHRFSLGDPPDVQVHLAAARARLAGDE